MKLAAAQTEAVSTWVNFFLLGAASDALAIARRDSSFPVFITRDLDDARAWLIARQRGFRRTGLVASSGARRLRADGLGVTLAANDRESYVQWYLAPQTDVRSSDALEITANEYTCQGLELDYVGVCWGGDFSWISQSVNWRHRAFKGSRWSKVNSLDTQRFILNKYRVLLTSARMEMVIWIPCGKEADSTHLPSDFDGTYDHLVRCGARPLLAKELAIDANRDSVLAVDTPS